MGHLPFLGHISATVGHCLLVTKKQEPSFIALIVTEFFFIILEIKINYQGKSGQKSPSLFCLDFQKVFL